MKLTDTSSKLKRTKRGRLKKLRRCRKGRQFQDAAADYFLEMDSVFMGNDEIRVTMSDESTCSIVMRTSFIAFSGEGYVQIYPKRHNSARVVAKLKVEVRSTRTITFRP